MAIKLPQCIETYFATDRSGDPGAVAATFTENAIVKDEGRTYVGLNAIRKWREGTTQKYRYTAEPFSMETENDRTVVTSHLVGDFPGSPVDLRYFFVLSDNKIAELEITI